jgi:general secretion pathway protein D
LKTINPIVRLLPLVAVLLLSGCLSNPAIEESRNLRAEGRIDEGVLRLEQGMREAPGDRQLRTLYFLQRDLATGQLLAAAEVERAGRRFDAAQALYQRVQQLDASNPRVRDGLNAVTAERRQEEQVREAAALLDKGDAAAAERILHTILVQSPAHGEARGLLQKLRERAARAQAPAPSLKSAFSKPITLEFRDTPLKTVFEVIARSSGLNFVFDKDVRTDTKVTIFVRDTSIDEVVKLVLATNQLESKLLNENSVLIYPDTPAKTKNYQELVTRSFYLANADVKQAQLMIRTLVKTKDIFADEKLNLLVIKDTPQAVRLAERLLESLDMAEPEVMLEVEVLEVTRNKLVELGLRFPDQIGYGLLQPGNTTLAAGFVDLHNRGGLTSYVPNPALALNLKNQVGDGNLLANPRIRVKNREKAKIHIGDRVPVFTTTSTANVGVAASVSYLDVGLKLEVEPNIYLDDDVSIKVGLEVSSIVKEVSGPASTLAYQIGTRSAATVLRLKNGETQMLAGLISDEERSSANRLPGLGDIPGVGRLFSSQSGSSSKTEIVLLITPRVVRNLARPDALSAVWPAGSELSVGAPALRVKKAQPRDLSLSSRAPGGPRASAAPELQELPEPPTPAELAQEQEQEQEKVIATPPVVTVPATPLPAAAIPEPVVK